jgi:hypothetical protein
MGRRLAALLAFLMAAFIAAPASACSMAEGYRIPTNFELVRRAELIVLARVVSGPDAMSTSGQDDWVTLETVRVLKGRAPAEPLRVAGTLAWDGTAMVSMPTPLGPSHFSAGLGACIRLFYPRGGLLVAMFERTPEGLRQIANAWSRAVEDVEAPDGIWVRAVEAYVAAQQGVADSGLRVAAEARLATLRAEADDLPAQAIAEDLQHYLDATAPGGPIRRGGARWNWLDTPDSTTALLLGASLDTTVGLRCERDGATLGVNAFRRPGTPQLALVIGERRFEAEGETRAALGPGVETVSGTIPFTPALAEALRTLPAPAGVAVDGAVVSAPPGDVLQKLAGRCAALLAPAGAVPPAG